MIDQKRLTIIEILIVVAVIGLIGTLAAIAVSSARANMRDAARLSHVRQMQSALEDYFVKNNTYPVSEKVVALGYGSVGCLNTDGSQASCEAGSTGVLARSIPAAISAGLRGLSSCGGAVNAYCYSALNGGVTYGIQFELENTIVSTKLQKGLNCAMPEGMKTGACAFVSK